MSEYRVVCADGHVTEYDAIESAFAELESSMDCPCGPHRVEQYINGEWVEVKQ